MATLAQSIVENIGGSGNIQLLTHCATRLRINLKDDSKFNRQKIESIPQVFGTNKSGNQFQIIIGTTVSKVFDQIQKEYGIENSAGDTEKAQPKNKKMTLSFNAFLEMLSGCIAPIVPAIVGSGFLKVVLILCSSTGILSTASQTYKLFSLASDAVFYFLPLILAYTSAKRFKCDPILSIVVTSILVLPTFTSMISAATKAHSTISLLGLPVALGTYSSTVIPAIITVAILAQVERLVTKITPDVFSGVLKPLLIIVIMTPIVMIATGPVGYYLGEILTVVVNFLSKYAGAVAVSLLGIFSPFAGMTGFHLALFPIAIQNLATKGYDNLLLLVFFCSTISWGAASLAVFFKTKNKKLKSVALAGALSGLFAGVGEPGLYGIGVALKRPIYASMIGTAVSGLFAGIVHLKVFAMGAYSFVGLPAYIDPNNHDNLIFAIVTASISLIVTFAATWLIGFDDSQYLSADDGKTENEEKVGTNEEIVANSEMSEDEVGVDNKVEMEELLSTGVKSPVSGKIVPNETIPDKVFSSEVLGLTIAIEPTTEAFLSPFDGRVTYVYPTGHSIGLITDEGIELLVHIGVDTVKMNGNGFTVKCSENERVHAGQELLSFDKQKILDNGFSDLVILVFTNVLKPNKEFINKPKDIAAGEPLLNE